MRLPEEPDFLKRMLEHLWRLLESQDKEIATEAQRQLRLAWDRYRLEGDHYLEKLGSANDEQLTKTNTYYREKIRLLRRELRWLRESHRAYPRRVYWENRYQDACDEAKKAREDREQQAFDTAFPGFPGPLKMSPEVVKLIRQIKLDLLNKDKQFNRNQDCKVGKIVRWYWIHRAGRFLLRILVGEFWGFVILTLLVEQIFQKELEEYIDEIGHQLLSGWLIILLLVIFLFVCYKLKKEYIDRRLERYLHELYVTHLQYDIVEAASAQTMVEGEYIIASSVEQLAEKIARKHVEKHPESAETYKDGTGI